ncbi:MAG: hypothetical protein V3S55_09485 [Nitrospiraceae bacterium]
MAYQPIPTDSTGTGEPRVSSVDTETILALERIAEILERIQQQLALITGTQLGVGDKL